MNGAVARVTLSLTISAAGNRRKMTILTGPDIPVLPLQDLQVEYLMQLILLCSHLPFNENIMLSR